jgi:hypothetical protein
MEATPSIGDAPNGGNPTSTSRTETPGGSYVRRLRVTEIECERQGAHPCLLDVLACEGSLRLPEGVVLGEEAHREFMDQSGLLEELRAPRLLSDKEARAEATRLRLAHLSSPIEGELNRQICEALIGFGSHSVAVISEGLTRKCLKSIPEVKDAIREAWLYPEGLARQVEAASRGEEVPTWPVSILVEDRAK